MGHLGRSLPRKLLWFSAQPLSAPDLWLSLGSFERPEAATKGPRQEVCRFHGERGQSKKQVIYFCIPFSPGAILWGGAKAHHLKIHLDANAGRDWGYYCSLPEENRSKLDDSGKEGMVDTLKRPQAVEWVLVSANVSFSASFCFVFVHLMNYLPVVSEITFAECNIFLWARACCSIFIKESTKNKAILVDPVGDVDNIPQEVTNEGHEGPHILPWCETTLLPYLNPLTRFLWGCHPSLSFQEIHFMKRWNRRSSQGSLSFSGNGNCLVYCFIFFNYVF